MAMDDEITDVTIVGGGDSGLLAGLCIRKLNPGLDITVVDDFQQDIPQVGKSTYKKITEILHDFLEIDEQEFIATVKPVWKGTVYFRDWCGYEPFHFPFDGFVKFPSLNTPNAIEAYYHHYDELYDSPKHLTKGEAIVERGKSPMYYDPDQGMYRKYDEMAYHLNTKRFNAFLRDLCRSRDVELVDDAITSVESSGNRIDVIRSEDETYVSDLYIDASGFNRILKGELESDFVDFGFPLDSAYNTRIDLSLSDILPATVVQTGDHGWFWQIDTFDNRDFGYVYASDFASDREAMEEFLDHLDGYVTEDEVTKYEFSSGYYEEAWEGNCIAIGNAEGFVEPLQSTGLTTNAWAGVVLSNMLSSHGRINHAGIRETYNSWVNRAWKSIYDFIHLHYLYSDGDNEFWRTMRSLEPSTRLKRLVQEFDRNGFSTNLEFAQNVADIEDLVIFPPKNFFVIMRNMGEESTFYEEHDFSVSNEVRAERDQFYANIREEVNDFLTTEEVYKGIPQLANAD